MPTYEGATVDEAIQLGLKELGLTKSEVTLKIVEEGKKGFLGIGKKQAVVELTPKPVEKEPEESHRSSEELKERQEAAAEIIATVQQTKEVPTEAMTSEEASDLSVKEDLEDEEAIKELAFYLTNITKELNAPAMVRIKHEKDTVVFHLDNEKPGMLIGKHGKILNALQYLSQVFIHRAAKNKLSVVVNVGNYREKRAETLKRLANNTADKAKRTGQPVFLEPMPAFERKQIHAILSEDHYVTTHSEGDEPYRYLVVEPVKNKL
ncbi:RNA-binding cell elongation regulator Jag/EloR [Vagococcus humatus]|uniref:RNA-binding protein KhpB n=1 Tax=Vagococcus humatus TaxID=1889241 RepID=A0A429Z4G8_9ENTE|nr:RNA-binding cell elongation regulator Jag/EloR [Vagococcus humatus]RST88595.1 RNA-binding protein [Vagococcus humatus]